jgi:hypothetical protein
MVYNNQKGLNAMQRPRRSKKQQLDLNVKRTQIQAQGKNSYAMSGVKSRSEISNA